MNDVISLFSTCLAACGEPQPEQRRGKRGDAYGGPLTSREVPVARSTVEKVLRYAKDNERFVYQGNWASLIGLSAMDSGLVASISSEFGGRQVTASLTIGYANDFETQLFSGEWTRVYTSKLVTAEVRVFPTKLLPTVTYTSFGAVVSLKAGIRRRRWWLGRLIWGEWQTFELQGFRITPTYGEPITDSKALDYITPRFTWKDDDKAAMQVESKI